MGKRPLNGPLPAVGRGDPEAPRAAVYINVAESNSEYSDLRVTFEIKEGATLGPGRYIAWPQWKEEWGKYTAVLRQDKREEWDKKLQQSNEPPKPPPAVSEDDIPF
jgi:hypothetical protein